MSIAPKDEMARLLAGERPTVRGHGQLRVDLDDLRVEVAGLGELRQPVTASTAKQLAAIGKPAAFGLGTETVLDVSVRDTTQVPTDAVAVDWGGQLDHVLEAARETLGLGPRTRLTAELHSMLVYAKDQFFASHQDSEKHDDMIASLVVTLPSAHTGGELVVHGKGESTSYRGSRQEPIAVVLYADLRHEVQPVRSGHRISLTYNLIRHQSDEPDAAAGPVGDVALLLERHFTAPVPARWRGDDGTPPTRLVYLLDHEYTPRSLTWKALKGADITRVATLRAAGTRAGCEVVLALADVHETWQDDVYFDDDDFGGRRSRRRGGSVDPDPHQLIDSEVTLTHWRGAWARGTEEISDYVDGREVCASTPTVRLTPYESEHEGYMGNYGNTVDRWYHRAAVLVWPVRLQFVNRAQVSMAWAVADLQEHVDKGEADIARDDLVSMMPFWHRQIGGLDPASKLVDEALTLAADLDEPDLARTFLATFRIDVLTTAVAPRLLRLAETYGDVWAKDLVTAWSTNSRRGGTGTADPVWLAGLPSLTMALCDSEILPRAMVELAWDGVRPRITPLLAADLTSRVRGQLETLAGSLTSVLHAAAVCRLDAVADEVLASCRQGEPALPLLIPLLDAAANWPAEDRREARVGEAAAYAAQLLAQRLERPARRLDDWSVPAPSACDCDLCGQLAAFLSAPDERTLEWPLAGPNRRHIHSRIEATELPVTHTTRRQGRPFTLVLTKTAALFEREIDARGDDELALARVQLLMD